MLQAHFRISDTSFQQLKLETIRSLKLEIMVFKIRDYEVMKIRNYVLMTHLQNILQQFTFHVIIRLCSV